MRWPIQITEDGEGFVLTATDEHYGAKVRVLHGAVTDASLSLAMAKLEQQLMEKQ